MVRGSGLATTLYLVSCNVAVRRNSRPAIMNSLSPTACVLIQPAGLKLPSSLYFVCELTDVSNGPLATHKTDILTNEMVVVEDMSALYVASGIKTKINTRMPY